MGALVRHIAWQVEEAVGDGTTTAVVIARQLFNAASRQAAAGHNLMSIRRGLEKALPVVLAALAAQAQPLDRGEQIVALGRSITGDDTVGRLRKFLTQLGRTALSRCAPAMPGSMSGVTFRALFGIRGGSPLPLQTCEAKRFYNSLISSSPIIICKRPMICCPSSIVCARPARGAWWSSPADHCRRGSQPLR